MKFVEFLKSLFLPRRMVRFKNATVFIAIFIFVISSYLLVIPADYKVKHSFEKNIDESNLLYLQSIKNLPDNNEDVNKVIKEIYDKKLSIKLDERTLEAANMKFDKVVKDDSLFAVTTVSADNKWVINDKDTGVINQVSQNANPEFVIKDGKLTISDNVLMEDVTISGEVETVKLTVNSAGQFFINNNPTDIRCNNTEVLVSINDEGYILIDGNNSNVKKSKEHVVIYYVPQAKIDLYYNSVEYTNDNGKNINITFAIDLSEDCSLFKVDEKFTYSVEKFPNIQNTEYYLVVFYYNNLYYQSHPIGTTDLNIDDGSSILKESGSSIYYTNVNFDSDSFQSTTLGKETLINIIKTGYISRYNTLYSIITFVYTVGFTLFISFIFWLFFRKNGKLKSMREYYNIAGITNISCTIISFIILWFYPDGIGNFYPFLFSIYYLFVLYKINSAREAI